MKFGLHLGTRGPAAEPDTLLALARRAEAVGFTHLGLSDHVVIPTRVETAYPYTATGRWFAEDSGICLEQVTALGFLAAATTRLRLMPSVMVLPYRPAMLAAKMLATVDILSKGRLTVSVGVGWMEEEMALLDSRPFEARGRMSNEYIQAFRNLWTAPRPAFQGEFVAYDNLKFEPKPVQKPHPPIWVGGETPPARRRAGRLGDGWYPVCNNPAAPLETLAAWQAGLADVHAAAEKAGRDPAALTRAMLAIWYQMGEEKRGRAGDRLPFTGSAEAIRDDVGRWGEAGMQHVVIFVETADVGVAMDRIDRFGAEVIGRS